MSDKHLLTSFNETDLDEICSNENAASIYPWRREHFLSSITCGDTCLGYQDGDGGWLAHAVFRQQFDELEVLILSVALPYQRQGIAEKLLTEVFNDFAQKGVEHYLLEVRESNIAARALYQKLGFIEVGRRKAYYPTVAAGREDALLLSKKP